MHITCLARPSLQRRETAPFRRSWLPTVPRCSSFAARARPNACLCTRRAERARRLENQRQKAVCEADEFNILSVSPGVLSEVAVGQDVVRRQKCSIKTRKGLHENWRRL